MAFKIGFAAEFLENKRMESKSAVPEPAAAPRRSMVQVYFAERNMNLAYYNDQFDLHCGDTVYVDGKLESIEKTAKTAQSAYTDKADRLNAGTDGLLSALSQLQRALGDMTRSVQAAGDALGEKADKEG